MTSTSGHSLAARVEDARRKGLQIAAFAVQLTEYVLSDIEMRV